MTEASPATEPPNVQPGEGGGEHHVPSESSRWWRRRRAEAARWATLDVLKLAWCPGLITDIVIVRAETWLDEVER